MAEQLQSQYITVTGEKIPPYVDGPWWFTKLVREAERLPKGYGYCFRYDYAYVAVCAPLPLNVIYGWTYKFLNILRQGVAPGRYEKQLVAAYEKGKSETWEKLYTEYFDYQQLRRAYHAGREHAYALLWAEYQREEQERRRERDRTHSTGA